MIIREPADYQPIAQRLYHDLSARLKSKLPAAEIEHIGSSSVDGCLSKGDLDIYVPSKPPN